MKLRLPLVTTFFLTLSACGGGSGGDNGSSQGTSGNANLRSAAAASQVAEQLSYLDADSLYSTIAATYTFFPENDGTENRPCGSGTAIINRTGNSVTVTHNNCEYSSPGGEGQSGYRETLEGDLQITCSRFSASNPRHCELSNISLNQFKNTEFNQVGTPQEFSITTIANGTVTLDLANDDFHLTGTFNITGSATPDITFSDRYNNISFFEVFTLNSGNGSAARTSDGSFSYATNGLARCAQGSFTVQTIRPIVSNFGSNGDETISGQLRLTNTDGDQADIEFGGDGSITVTIGGNQTTFSSAQVENYCR